MILTSLTLKNFRNYTEAQLSLDQGIHLITGKNAQGKTNLLEAVYYLSTTRSHRTNDDRDLIKQGETFSLLTGRIGKQGKQVDLRIALSSQGKNLFRYRTPMKKVSDFIGELNAILFCPDDMALFQASPRVRRRFIDIELSKISKSYTRVLNEAGRLLKERNACLKQHPVDLTYLDILSERLIDQQVIIIKQRQRFLQDLLKRSQAFYEKMASDQTRLSFIYQCCVPYWENEAELKALLKEKYEKNRERDLLYQQTTVGIHKEDVLFLIDDQELRNYASQGQKRSVLLAMKIGLVMMVHDLMQEYPILLLDDVFSELDAYRQRMLLQELPKDVQILITTTDSGELPLATQRDVHIWQVDAGKIKQVK